MICAQRFVCEGAGDRCVALYPLPEDFNLGSQQDPRGTVAARRIGIGTSRELLPALENNNDAAMAVTLVNAGRLTGPACRTACLHAGRTSTTVSHTISPLS